LSTGPIGGVNLAAADYWLSLRKELCPGIASTESTIVRTVRERARKLAATTFCYHDRCERVAASRNTSPFA